MDWLLGLVVIVFQYGFFCCLVSDVLVFDCIRLLDCCLVCVGGLLLVL